MKKITAYLLGIACFGALFFVQNTVYALNVPLKRIVFDNNYTSETLDIENTSDHEQVYSAHFLHYEMRENKGLHQISKDKPVENVRWADDLIDFTPKELIVPPKSSRKLKLFLKFGPYIKEGEYRTHIQIKEMTSDKENKEDVKGAHLKMKPGVVMPVFIRWGDLKASVEIVKAQFVKSDEEDKPDRMNVTLKREGTRSIYGDFEVFCTASAERFLVKKARGFAMYTENEQRDMSFKLKIKKDQEEACGSMIIKYVSRLGDVSFKGQTMALAQVSF